MSRKKVKTQGTNDNVTQHGIPQCQYEQDVLYGNSCHLNEFPPAAHAHLAPAEMVEQHHTDEVHQHAQSLEGENRHAQGAVSPCHAGRVVLTESTALLARQTQTGTFWKIPVMWQPCHTLPT